MAIPNEKLADMYTVMVRIRAFEERVLKEFTAGNIPGFCHLYIGEEAIATGACATLRPDDYITSTHRGHGHVIAKGAKTNLMMAELFGKKTGYNKGKGGSMHIADPDIGILGANGIVGAGITIAGGAALSSKLRKSGQITICFIGDGATNTSRFHEGVNLAAAFDLPIVYVIENNMYAISVRFSEVCKIKDIAARGCAYGIPGVTIDGNNVVSVYETVSAAVARARQGEGPTLVECKTFRPRGHFIGDAQMYIKPEELEEWIKKDPLPRFRKQLIKMSVLSEKDAVNIENGINEEIDEAVKFAQESHLPHPDDVLEDVYA